MKNRQLHIGFIKQFRQEYIVSACAGKQQHPCFSFRLFKGNKNEITALRKFLVKELIHSKAIDNLIIKLENKDNPDICKLSCFAQKLLKIFSSYAHDEPYTAYYYNRSLTILNPFLLMVDTFEKAQQYLLEILKLLFSDKVNSARAGSVYSEDVDDLQTAMEQYIDEAKRYYDDFNAFVEQEPDNSHAVRVTSQVTQYLLELLMLIEKSMFNAETTNARLEAWKKQLASREVQEIYN